MQRRAYAEMYGPTVGDRVRLADTELFIEVEDDYTLRAGGYGEEVKFGGGKTIRDGMGQGQRPNGPGAGEAVDCVVTNALILDHWGVVKADIGLRGSRIAAIGKAGNPDVQPGVDIVIGPGTEVIAAEGLIVTAGGVDTHIHFICPQQIEEALASGVTTMLGGGTGPATGTFATTCTPGPENIARMLQAADAFPMNLGFFGKGNASRPEALVQQVEAGAVGLKLHEDWGTTPSAIDCCLVGGRGGRRAGGDPHRHAQRERLRRGHHRGLQGPHHPHLPHRGRRRRPRARHPEGGRRGQRAAELDQPDPALHRQHARRAPRHADGVPPPRRRRSPRTWPSPRAASAARPSPPRTCCTTSARSACSAPTARRWAASARSILRTWQTAHKMKLQRGALGPAESRADNFRARRYVAKYTINPAIAHGIAHEVGSIEVGKWADLVFWRPAFFGVKPSLVMKGGFIAMAAMGDPNASIPTPQPVHSRPMFGAFGGALGRGSLTFMSQVAIAAGLHEALGLHRQVAAVKRCRGIGKRDMVLNDHAPRMEVDAQTYEVRADGVLLTCEPAAVLPMAQRYFLF